MASGKKVFNGCDASSKSILPQKNEQNHEKKIVWPQIRLKWNKYIAAADAAAVFCHESGVRTTVHIWHWILNSHPILFDMQKFIVLSFLLKLLFMSIGYVDSITEGAGGLIKNA